MADNFISSIKLGETIYSIKDKYAREAIENLGSTIASSLVFKGVVASSTEVLALTDYKIGWTYKASSDFEIANLGKIETGDMIICIADYDTAFNISDWTVVQSNIDVFVGATDTEDSVPGLVPQATSADKEKFLGGDGQWHTVDAGGSTWGKFTDLS